MKEAFSPLIPPSAINRMDREIAQAIKMLRLANGLCAMGKCLMGGAFGVVLVGLIELAIYGLRQLIAQ
ncbi:protein of unknown function [Pararobbsia alpina]|uniref:hypothetical protein n=1 Tax=Pararobbsia alpina TaxID=621374 RepID=UPI0039A50666